MVRLAWWLETKSFRLQVTGGRILGWIVSLVVFCFIPIQALAFSIETVEPSTLSSPEDITHITLNLSDLPSGAAYFRVAFTKTTDNPKYFGSMKTDKGQWVEVEALSKCQNYYKVENVEEGTLTIDVKMGQDSEAGKYFLRAHRLTTSACSSTSTDFYPVTYQEALPSPSPNSQSSPSPESSSKAECKINEPKDDEGNALYSVKIYIDGTYVHHYAPETLTFCADCDCDGYVACGFGEHTIKLEKTGYEPWSESKNISQGDSFEVNPTLKTVVDDDENSSGPSPEPTAEAQVLGSTSQKSLSTDFQSTKADNENFDTSFSGEILNASNSGEEGEKEEEKQEEISKKKSRDWLIPLGLSGAGLVLLSTAALPFVKPKLGRLLASFHKKSFPADS